MRDLLRANFSRLFRSWVLLGAALVMVGGAVAICIGAYHNMVLYNEPGYTEPLDQVLFQAEQALGGAAAIVLSLFVGAEYSSGTIRNQLMVEESRETVYLAGYLTCAGAAFILFMLPSLAALALGSVLFSAPSVAPDTILIAFFVGAMTCLLYAAIFHFIAVVCGSRTWAAIISLLLAAALLLAAGEVSPAPGERAFTPPVGSEKNSTPQKNHFL